MPFAWAAGAAALGSIGSAVIGGDAAQSAASTQAAAANAAAQVQQNMFNTTQKNLQPYMQSGAAGNSILEQLLGITPATAGTKGQPGTAASFNPNAPLAANYQAFTPTPAYTPLTAATFQQSPGYQYELQQQQQAIQNSAAARGGAIGGNTLNSLQQNAQGLASQDWYNANNLNIANYNTASQGNIANYTTGYDAFSGNRNYLLSALQNLQGTGANAAANLGGFSATAAGAIGGDLIGAGNATAAGTIGAANALSGGLNGVTTSLASYLNPNSAVYGGGTSAWGGAGTTDNSTGTDW
jgi:hypothetical protein